MNEQFLKRLMPLWESLEECLRTGLGSLPFDAAKEDQVLAVCLHARTLSLANACRHLFQVGNLVGVPVMLRSILEGYVDLRILLRDPSYLGAMLRAFYEQERFLYKNFDPAGQYNGALTSAEAAAKLSEIDAKIGQLPSKQSIADRFRAAGAIDWYSTVYNELCRQSHNNMDALRQWHLAPGGRVVAIKEPQVEGARYWGTTIPNVCVASFSEVATFLNVTDRRSVDDATALRDQIRAVVAPPPAPADELRG